ncbi:MAG: fatty acid hydroxylase [Robiginitomaculum sp.]|nr:MAG: fatty acid hydroxylase [Robiginitomaculum sp.]
MPTPLEILLDPISFGVIGLYIIFISLETFFPARKLPPIQGWKLRGIISFIVYFFLSTYLPLIWDKYLTGLQIFDLKNINPFLATVSSLCVFEFLIYVWHRTMHSQDWLWLPFHQMHHSAERVDSYGAFYYSPLDMAGFTMVGSLSLSIFAGLSAQTITLFLFVSLFLVMFQHANIRTPQWIGYFIQRPESHTIHHQTGMHAYNYSDFPIFDIFFGTFKNPKGFQKETGFYTGASDRIPEMLMFRDVSKIDK